MIRMIIENILFQGASNNSYGFYKSEQRSDLGGQVGFGKPFVRISSEEKILFLYMISLISFKLIFPHFSQI